MYENILNVAKRELATKKHDPLYKGTLKALSKCVYYGATTDNPNTKADKLYSPHLPFAHFDDQWISVYRHAGYCGPNSTVGLIKERYPDEAMKLAKDQQIRCEPSGIAGPALLLQIKVQIPKDKKLLIVNTRYTKLS